MIKKSFAIAIIALGLMSSCSNDEISTEANLTVDLNGLQDLGADYVYEGWLIVNGAPITTGVFDVNSSGDLSKTSFTVDRTNLETASKFVLTIEPRVDSDPKPSDTKYMVGDFSGKSATLSTGVIGDFSGVAGKYILATPTDNVNGDNGNNENGIWWLDPTTTPPSPTLVLPELPAGWKYEGWVVSANGPVTTGTFTKVAATDDAAPFSGPVALGMPNGADGFFPGEDFLNEAPTGITFPLDVRGKTAVISIEPYPDNSPAPFTLKPLVATTGQDTAPVLHSMSSNVTASFPTGSVWR